MHRYNLVQLQIAKGILSLFPMSHFPCENQMGIGALGDITRGILEFNIYGQYLEENIHYVMWAANSLKPQKKSFG